MEDIRSGTLDLQINRPKKRRSKPSMKVLVACEESQAVCMAFRERESMKHILVTCKNVLVGILNGTSIVMCCRSFRGT